VDVVEVADVEAAVVVGRVVPIDDI